MKTRIPALFLAILLLFSPLSEAEKTAPAQPYTLDYTRISPMIIENFPPEVIDAALEVIDAFLNYETSVHIPVQMNSHLLTTSIGYILNSSCPAFAAFTDFHEIRSFDEATDTLHWNYTVPEEEFRRILADFELEINACLSLIDSSDSEVMKALLLYMALTDGGVYDHGLVKENYETLSEAEYNLRASTYYTLMKKSGVCFSYSQALVFLYAQAGLESASLCHTGGFETHSWPVMKLDGEYYYCDPTWDLEGRPYHFGMTAADRELWAGGYDASEGSIINVVVPEKYDITDDRFEELRSRLPVEVSAVRVDKERQTITFVGYEYEYTLHTLPEEE